MSYAHLRRRADARRHLPYFGRICPPVNEGIDRGVNYEHFEALRAPSVKRVYPRSVQSFEAREEGTVQATVVKVVDLSP